MKQLLFDIKKIIFCCILAVVHTTVAAQSFKDLLKDSIRFVVVSPDYWNKKTANLEGGNDILIVHMGRSIDDSAAKLTNKDWKELLKDSVLSYGANLWLFTITGRGTGGYEIFRDKKRWYRVERRSYNTGLLS